LGVVLGCFIFWFYLLVELTTITGCLLLLLSYLPTYQPLLLPPYRQPVLAFSQPARQHRVTEEEEQEKRPKGGKKSPLSTTTTESTTHHTTQSTAHQHMGTETTPKPKIEEITGTFVAWMGKWGAQPRGKEELNLKKHTNLNKKKKIYKTNNFLTFLKKERKREQKKSPFRLAPPNQPARRTYLQTEK
jgi:hypothetical protein